MVVGIAIILVAALYWSVLDHTLNLTGDIIINSTPETINNYTVNIAEVTNEIVLTENIYYIYFFIIIIIVFMWVHKRSVSEQDE